MWKRIRKQHKDGRLMLVCIEGEDESVDIARYENGKWTTADDSDVYPDGLTPTHCATIPTAAKPSGNVVAMSEYVEQKSPKALLEEFMDIQMDSVMVMATTEESFSYGFSADSVADAILLLEMVKQRIMSGALHGTP